MAFYQDYKPRKMTKQDHLNKDWKDGEKDDRYHGHSSSHSSDNRSEGNGYQQKTGAYAIRTGGYHNARPAGGSYQQKPAPYGKPANGSFDRKPAPYGKPANGSFEQKPAPYGKPANGSFDRKPAPYGRPAGGSFDRKPAPYGKPANGSFEQKPAPYGKPAGGSFDRKPAPYGAKPTGNNYQHKNSAPRNPGFDKRTTGYKAPAGPYGRPANDHAAPQRAPMNKPYEAVQRPVQPRVEQPAAPVAPQFDTPYTKEPENLLSGRNPIREALKAGRDIEKLLVAKGDLSGSAREIVAMAREKKIPVQVVERTRLDEITHNHQGMLAFASAYQYSDVESMLALAKEKGEEPFLIILDGVTDPHNLGAIIRTAACVGAHGVIVPERRAVGLTPAAVKASAGAVETVKVARVTNLTRTLEMLKKEGLWFYAADMEGEDFRQVKMEGPVALIIGSEGEGISRLVLEQADHKVKLPMYGGVQSLNASVAAGVLMYAVMGFRKE